LAYQKSDIIQQKLKEQGFQSEFITSGSKESPKDTDTQLFIGHSGTTIVIAFRGTENIRDWVTDTKIRFVNVRHHGKVHRGFNDALDSVWPEIIKTLKGVHVYAQSLWITGHSVGGALIAGHAQAHQRYLYFRPTPGRRSAILTRNR